MINVSFEKDGDRISRIFASSRYPSEQKGNVFYDSQITPKISFDSEMPIKLECLHATVAFRPSHILLSRDVLGGKPIYYDSFGISSFKKRLENPTEVLPGEVVKIDYSGKVLEKRNFRVQEVFGKYEITVEEAEEKILRALENHRFKNACIAFSGGVDSAFLASIYDLPLVAVTASEEDRELLLEASKKVSRDIEILKVDEKEVLDILGKVSEIIEDQSLLQLSIAIPLHFVFEFARELGFSELVLGQGADELFGGYKRYEKLGKEELEKRLTRDLEEIGNKNLVRDAKLSYASEIKLVLPYLSWDVIRVAMSLPVDLKVAELDGRRVRKYFLRRLAEKFLPEEIAWREKKAIQYSTGIAKILKRWFSRTTRDLGF
ncbi:MAG: asparagine synthase C-terminal domain-containing protein [Archaeoglobaceae archaeon]